MRPARVERWACAATAETIGEDIGETVERCASVKVGVSAASLRAARAEAATPPPAPSRTSAVRAPSARTAKGRAPSHAGREASASSSLHDAERAASTSRAPKDRDSAGAVHALATKAPEIPTPICEAAQPAAAATRAPQKASAAKRVRRRRRAMPAAAITPAPIMPRATASRGVDGAAGMPSIAIHESARV